MRIPRTSVDATAPEVSFGFRCKRSGRCCQVRGGVAWVDPAEQQAIAAHMSMPIETFHAKHTRELTDPRTGELRSALRDREDGACELLEAGNQCSVYEARPKQCRDFPFWDSVADDPASFERARDICPGIEVIPSGEFTQRVVRQLGELMTATSKAPTAACPHDQNGELVHVSRLEFEAIAAAVPGSQSSGSRACPSYKSSLCTSPSAKPIACRELGESACEDLNAKLQDLHKGAGYPHTMGTIGSFAAPDPEQQLAPLQAPGMER
jgi:Fe-S-cluster containining protein